MTLLAPGHHLYLADDGSWRLSAPRDRFVRLTGDPATLTAFQHVVHGAVAPGADAMAGTDPSAYEQLRELFTAQQLLVHDTTAPTPAVRDRRDPASATVLIEIDGDDALGLALAPLLPGAAEVVQGPVDEDAVRAADVVISCAGWLPDARWRELDRWCARHATAWHRIHAEDLRFFLGPMTVPGRTASYEDLRGRRLAASGVAEELVRHWAYLDDPRQTAPPVPWPDRAGLATLAGLLARDVVEYLRTGAPAVANTQLEVDLATSEITHHHVLPLPLTARSDVGEACR